MIRTDALQAKDIENALKRANRAWRIQLHIRNKEFHIKNAKDILSSISNEENIFILFSSFVEHIFEVIYALPKEVDVHYLKLIATENKKNDLEKHFEDREHIILPGNRFNLKNIYSELWVGSQWLTQKYC